MQLILGLGKTGCSIARFLAKQKQIYRIADSRFNPPLLKDYLAEFPASKPILGAWHEDLLTDIDEIFISPGIAQDEKIVVCARKKNIQIISDIELFGRFAKSPIIGITGSNGKSTVTQLLTNMIDNSGLTAVACGNIGVAALDCLADEVDFYVLELSNYQLDYTDKLPLLTGVVLNIAEDHLERYQSFEDYVNTKLKLYQFCQKCVINIDEALIPKYWHQQNPRKFSLNMRQNGTDFATVIYQQKRYLCKGDDRLMSEEQTPLIGYHNLENILAALTLGDEIGLNMIAMIESIKTFAGLEHRLEWLGKKRQIDYYNDSKATNATATINAIEALSKRHKNIVLILGGVQKKEDYSALFALIQSKIKAAILIGQCSETFAHGIKKTPKKYAQSMSEALYLATQMINDGAILLSPAAASFDMFADFRSRGIAFKQAFTQIS